MFNFRVYVLRLGLDFSVRVGFIIRLMTYMLGYALWSGLRLMLG